VDNDLDTLCEFHNNYTAPSHALDLQVAMSNSKGLAQLRLYLQNLPKNLSLPASGHSVYGFEHFAPDAEWVEDIGEEGAVNRQLEILLGSRVKGPIRLIERGPSICAVVDVLDKYLARHPKSLILQKWVSDLTVSATLAYESAQVSMSSHAPKASR